MPGWSEDSCSHQPQSHILQDLGGGAGKRELSDQIWSRYCICPAVCTWTHHPYVSRGLYHLAADPRQYPHPIPKSTGIACTWVNQLSQQRRTRLHSVPASYLCSCFLPTLTHTHENIGGSDFWQHSRRRYSQVETPRNLTPQPWTPSLCFSLVQPDSTHFLSRCLHLTPLPQILVNKMELSVWCLAGKKLELWNLGMVFRS